HDDEESRDAERLPQLALARLVDLAHDRVVADVLLNGVLERLHQAILSAARSFALRARGLRPTSSTPGTNGFFVSTFIPARPRSGRWGLRASARSVCFTMRSSSEWNVMMTSRAATASLSAATATTRSRPSSSRWTH